MGLYRVDDKDGEPLEVGAGKVDYKDMYDALMKISNAPSDPEAEYYAYYEGPTACMDVTMSDGSFYKGYVYL
jgi:hypothetical protein